MPEFMRIVLQHAKNAQYLKSLGEWTESVAEAQNFTSSQRAIKFIRQHHLQEVQVLVAFVEPAYVDMVALQIPEPQRLTAAVS